MKQRLLAAAVLVPITILLVLVAPVIFAAVIYGVLIAIAVYELLYTTRLVRHSRLVLYSAIMAFAVVMWGYFGSVHAYLLLGLLVFCLLLFSEMMMDHVKVRIEQIGLCLMAGFVVPLLLGSVIRILAMENGRAYAIVPFVIACFNDAGAYFVGIKFGRHKLAPVVSPNKSIEGALGGIATTVVCMLIYSLLVDIFAKQLDVNYGYAMLYAIFGAIAGVFGDLCFSIIKRQTGVKDYGHLIPGHGGVLDRLDSMMTVAPLIEALLLLIPFAE